ncbi:hypothetical protein BSLG_005362 [Batrachochytrium salamandrivorans]|nr:hypothetical protein BSLG_005362 [Batrachochytrium salamandrivorans]
MVPFLFISVGRSLPYIDPDYDPDVVQALIDAEIQTTLLQRPTAAMLDNDSVILFKDRPALKDLLDKAAVGTKTQTIDTVRFRLQTPVDDKGWSEAISNAQAQLEHQGQRLINLELVTRMGANSWRIHNYQLEATVKNLKCQLEACKEEIEAVNKIRKADQMHARPTLVSMEERWSELIRSIISVRMENQRLDTQIEQLKTQVAVQ